MGALEHLQLLREALTKRTEVRDLCYRDATIPVDGYHFLNCRFERCVLVSRTADFVIEGCHIGCDSTVRRG